MWYHSLTLQSEVNAAIVNLFFSNNGRKTRLMNGYFEYDVVHIGRYAIVRIIDFGEWSR